MGGTRFDVVAGLLAGLPRGVVQLQQHLLVQRMQCTIQRVGHVEVLAFLPQIGRPQPHGEQCPAKRVDDVANGSRSRQFPPSAFVVARAGFAPKGGVPRASRQQRTPAPSRQAEENSPVCSSVDLPGQTMSAPTTFLPRLTFETLGDIEYVLETQLAHRFGGCYRASSAPAQEKGSRRACLPCSATHARKLGFRSSGLPVAQATCSDSGT